MYDEMVMIKNDIKMYEDKLKRSDNGYNGSK